MGRQPTSGYCQTCRKRRVKCDKERPHCGRCLASGHTCAGYDLPLRTHVLGVRSHGDGTRQLVRVMTPDQGPLAPALHPETPLSPCREDMSASYFFGTFNWAPFWRPLLLSATNDDFHGINKVCFKAISCGYMGVGLGDSALQAKGRQLYGQVLGDLRSLLIQPAKHQLAKLGFTLILMGMYEFAINETMGRAPPHHVGIIQILQYCGPETFQNERLLEVYRSCRALLICQGLCRQSRCFLEATSWKTIPWALTPKTFEDRLMDIIVDLPGIAEAVTVPNNRAACLNRIDALSVALRHWRWEWHSANSASVRRVQHELDAEDGRKPFITQMLQVSLEFDSQRLALDIFYYNAALLYLMQLKTAACGQTPQPEVLSPRDEDYIRRQAAISNPLLLPGQVRFRCQAAAEAVTTLSCITRLMASTPSRETVVTPYAIGIIYWVLRDQLQLGDYLERVLSRYSVFHDAQRVFAGYFVSVGDRATSLDIEVVA